MDAMSQIAQTLGAIPQTPQERRQARNRRYYEKNRFIWQWYNEIRKLRRLKTLLDAA